MKTMFAAFAAALAIAVIADAGLDTIGFSSSERYAAPGSVRLD
ncbi:hypothetical protein JSE7799_01722 [Jannaschia seosinensis]|uniref:Uncharacterized protein n=1 Tax=Jannaschia seosinensis TaxID=313367 RepID=A0A0M7BAQ0_9RHOB|nr:hypothetical protein [Jannaschia seosinensis]CUH39003.1 hypothetical protein JSE7799_01722 [Jannaschia seosinensis]